MSDEFQKRLDDELGSTLDAIAADKARKLLASRLSAELADVRHRESKSLLEALVVPHMKSLATKLGLRAARTGETDPASERQGWFCAIPMELTDDASLASYAGDIIACSVIPESEGEEYAIHIWSRLHGKTRNGERTISNSTSDRTNVQKWIDEELIHAAQSHLGIEPRDK